MTLIIIRLSPFRIFFATKELQRKHNGKQKFSIILENSRILLV